MGQNPDIRDLFRILYRPLCVYALHYLKDADAVEDVVQEAFTAWWQKGDVADNARAYLYAIVRNRCIDILRRQGRQPEQLQPEDAAGAVSVKPSELNFRCTLEFEQVDFVSCRLSFQEDATPVAGSFEWNAAKLPSFLCGENADITLSNPRIALDYQSDFPFSWARHDFAVLYGDDKAGFSCSGPSGQITETLEPFFHSPFREGNLQPEFFYQPVLTGEATIVPGQNYSMRAKIDLAVPLAFTGNIDAKAVSTPSLQLNGDALGAPANSTHMIKQKVGSTLPVDCRITPVFTMEGEEPVSLDEFILDAKHREVEFSHSFRPAKDHWTATLSYLVTPIRGTGEYLMKADSQCLTVGDCSFTANYREE